MERLELTVTVSVSICGHHTFFTRPQGRSRRLWIIQVAVNFSLSNRLDYPCCYGWSWSCEQINSQQQQHNNQNNQQELVQLSMFLNIYDCSFLTRIVSEQAGSGIWFNSPIWCECLKSSTGSVGWLKSQSTKLWPAVFRSTVLLSQAKETERYSL